jgi:hypothetical protein
VASGRVWSLMYGRRGSRTVSFWKQTGTLEAWSAGRERREQAKRRRGGEVDKSNPAAPWLMVQEGTGCYRQQCRRCSSRGREAQSAAEDGQEGCVVVEWEWGGKKRGQDEAGQRWSQKPNAWQCAGRVANYPPASSSELFGRASSLARPCAEVLASHDSAGARDMCRRAISCQSVRTISPCITATRRRRMAAASKIAARRAGWSSSAGQLASWQREALGGADMQMRMSDENPRQAHAAAAGSLGRRAPGRCGVQRAAMRLCWAGGGHARC